MIHKDKTKMLQAFLTTVVTSHNLSFVILVLFFCVLYDLFCYHYSIPTAGRTQRKITAIAIMSLKSTKILITRFLGY